MTSPITVSEVTHEGLTHIVRNLRERDRHEIFALRWDDDEAAFVNSVMAVAGDLWRMWHLDGEPVAIAGVIPIRPGVTIGGAFGTEKWPRVVRSITRFGIQFIVPVLKANGYHRIEVYVLASNTDSAAWIELMGGKLEAVLKGFGRAREDYLLYANDLTRDGGTNDVFLWRGEQGGQYGTADGSTHCH